ncbi:ArsR/SmtB family transcription factor [Actinacidiphila acidipaludis]|uniref:Winged helix-turn-helix domain-containing protein n=1 Tax=Actinacidiphila acidipaludis TaxID=2873382 RepID=A0ABS7Q5G4_9ACTN|nr:winged helix-turn-helix domain-containing protein [Streptomyces acidipaludis]MBY8878398.1 winged helix-turn-helix domain-containing protein [Streptomyces acidipaludis]
MLTLRFTVEDLLRVRFAPGPAPLVETGLALSVLRAGSRDPALTRWGRTTSAGMSSRNGAAAGRLLQLLRSDGLGPTFLDPPVFALDEALDRVAATPQPRVSAELRRLWNGRPGPGSSWASALERHEARAWRELTSTLARTHDALLEPWWPRLRAGYAADVAWRTQVQQQQGLRAMLAGLVPGAAWSGADLRLPGRGQTTVVLGGGGLTLMPSLLWRGVPLRTRHPDGSLLLVYSALTPLPLVPAPGAPTDPLAALLGATRALALHLLTEPQSTTGLARTLGVSAGSASAHAKTLRAAGLVATVRDGKHVRHTCTPLGRLLLSGSLT